MLALLWFEFTGGNRYSDALGAANELFESTWTVVLNADVVIGSDWANSAELPSAIEARAQRRMCVTRFSHCIFVTSCPGTCCRARSYGLKNLARVAAPSQTTMDATTALPLSLPSVPTSFRARASIRIIGGRRTGWRGRCRRRPMR
jgi:hypothetical protein